MGGFEPPQPCGHMALNHARLPVPPHSQMVENDGFEPSTPCTSSKCSPTELILHSCEYNFIILGGDSQDKLRIYAVFVDFLNCHTVNGTMSNAALQFVKTMPHQMPLTPKLKVVTMMGNRRMGNACL